ncbi:MAG: class I SAM-dependent methyltransferase [Chloroflexi bacterium]|nr:class I SAM-dependent methyltransferase [Chloroflexota bacterium]
MSTSPARSSEALYAHLSNADRYIHETRDEAFFSLLKRHAIVSLEGLRVLELGCGDGAMIRSLAHYGANLSLIDGIDINPARASSAHTSYSPARIAAGDASHLPYRDASFDLALAFTSLSSMTDDAVRHRAATEALRVLRPGGILVVYDFCVNPTNPATRPLQEAELRDLFRDRRVEIERVTLAPPIVRILRGHRALCRPLERLPWLRTHLLAAVTKEPQ